MAMGAFRTHNVWQVRMYAARAAEPLKDIFTLQKLAYDDNDNVREAALMPLQRLAGADSEPAFIAALGRNDYQLVLTAALGLKGRATDRYVLAAVAGALERITAEKKETSRDTRLALLERLREAGRSQAPLFEKLLGRFRSTHRRGSLGGVARYGDREGRGAAAASARGAPGGEATERCCSPGSSSIRDDSSRCTSTGPSRRWPTSAFRN